MEKEMSAGS